MNTHSKSVAQLKKMSTKQLLALYVQVLEREPSEILSDRQSLILVLSVHSSEETESEEVAAKRFRETQKKLIRFQIAEQRASIPGWKRDWIRRLRNGGRGASWNQIMELTGVHTNVCSGIVSGTIYKWDTDSDAKFSIVNEKPNFQGMMTACGIVKHEEHDLDRFFA